MFEFLSLVKAEQAVMAANIAIRFLEGRRDVFFDDSFERSNSEDPWPNETELAFRAFAEIQNTVKMPLSGLSEEISNQYLLALAQIAIDSTSKTLSVRELRRAQRILEAWKNEKPANAPEWGEQIGKSLGQSRKAKSSISRIRKRRDELNKYREMSEDELRREARRLNESLFRLNYKLAAGEVDAVKQIHQKRQSLKRINTLMKRRHAEQHSN